MNRELEKKARDMKDGDLISVDVGYDGIPQIEYLKVSNVHMSKDLFGREQVEATVTHNRETFEATFLPDSNITQIILGPIRI